MATLAQLTRFAQQGNRPVAQGSTYNPMAYAYTLEQALQPTGMQTAYGDPYVGSKWTRFNQTQPGTSNAPAGQAAVSGFGNARNQAFMDWANQLGKTVGGVQFQQLGNGAAPYAANFGLPGDADTVTLQMYDDWTKKGIDPAAAVRQLASGGAPVLQQGRNSASAMDRLSRVARSVDLASRLRNRRGR